MAAARVAALRLDRTLVSFRARFRSVTSFLGRVLTKSRQDELGLRTSALAFSTLLALVPLLAGVSVFLARTVRADDRRLLELAAGLLPYPEESILAALESFVEQTASVSGIAILGFVLTALLTFFAVQSTLFKIFRVERAPSLWRRIVTFTVLVFWGPLLVGSAQAGYLLLSQTHPELARELRDSRLFALVPKAITFLGFTMLYWRASLQRVRFREAAIGSLIVTVALEVLTEVFQVYVAQFAAVQRAVYGTFAIILFFVLSIQLAWWILLFGAEIVEALADRRRGAPIQPMRFDPDPWYGLGALELLARPERPWLGAHELAPDLGLDAPRVVEHLRPLVEAGILESQLLESGGGYRLALPAQQIRLAAVLAAYRRLLAAEPAGPLPEHTAAIRLRLRRALEHDVREETLADLMVEKSQPMTTTGSLAIPDPAEAPALARAERFPLDRPEGRG